jgi:hypothetical protein
MSIFSKNLSSQFAYDLAKVILEVFKIHYRTFRKADIEAKNMLLLGDHRANFFLPNTWRILQNQVNQGIFHNLFNYPQHLRFIITDLPSSDERIST